MSQLPSSISTLRLDIEDFVLRTYSNGSQLAFNSSHYEHLGSLLSDWKSETFSHKLSIGDIDYSFVSLPFCSQPFLWPHRSYGNLQSDCSFSPMEFMVWLTYKFTAKPVPSSLWDIGAHEGIDSFVMASMLESSTITSFEPDPLSCDSLRQTLSANHSYFSNPTSFRILLIESGLSNQWQKCEFIRVLGNTMASHVTGSRSHYGDSDSFSVQLVPHTIFSYPDFLKINIEGHEKELVPSLDVEQLQGKNMIIEIHSSDCMQAVYDFCVSNDLHLYTQSSGYCRETDLHSLPVSNKQGYVFVSPVKEDCMLSF